MSEEINYIFEAVNLTEEQQEELKNTLFQDNTFLNTEDFWNYSEVGHLDMGFLNSWRGGGKSCEELVQELLKDFMDKYPEVEINVSFEYVEKVPTERFKFKGGVYNDN